MYMYQKEVILVIVKKVTDNLIKYINFERRPVMVMTVSNCNSHQDLAKFSTKIPKVSGGGGEGGLNL